MGFSYLFYRSIILGIILSPLSIFYAKIQNKELVRKRKWQLNLEFRDGIQCLVVALNAGYSIENSFVQARGDLKMVYSQECYIIKEFEYIINQLKMNRTIEVVLREFALRSDVEDIYNFSEIFTIAKRTKGDMIKVIRITVNNISAKIEVQREIQTIITGKKLEVKIMNITPFALILYMIVFSPGFLNPLYHNIGGVIIMSIALIIYLIAFILSKRIINIQV
jgi:tight adherence protein B